MKKLKYVGIILSLMLMISYSCNKEEVFEDEVIEYTKLSEEEIQKGINTLNYQFSSPEMVEKSEKDLQEKIGDTFENVESLIQTYGSLEANFNPINTYLQMKGLEPVNTDKVKSEAFNIITSNNSTFEDLASILLKYKLYSKEQIHILKDFDKKASTITDDITFLNLSNDFQASLFKSSLPEFERSTLLLYSSMLKIIYKPSIYNNATINKVEDILSPCSKCISKNAWKIFGWGFLFALLIAIACLVVGWWLAIVCMIAAFSSLIVLYIKIYCCKVCVAFSC